MLTRVADDVFVHESDFLKSNAVVVRGASGVVLIDAGISRDELATIASDLREAGDTVVAGFSTHPHWDHLLWHPELGDAPRYGTARCAAAIRGRLSTPGWEAMVAGMLPPDIADEIPVDALFGRITALDAGADRIPWDGPGIRIIEHEAHAPGHAALLVEEHGVLVAGDMLSDVLIPMLNGMAENPIEDYLTALERLEGVADAVDIVIPGHGSVVGGAEYRKRIALDRAYVLALRDGVEPADPRIGPHAQPGWEWVGEAHARQREYLARLT
ncbi:MBL fold metallo-hydrolase [Parafrigoribacterium soli]|uniref:MBL fold metallo-hydrolase n=1 Tax=Parafrigoribacterium soli TaxID=3144663 RepID=UPI0032EC3162